MNLERFRQTLIRWFAANARDLPWRRTSDPYAIWISEIMLQQTQTSTVIPYYQRFLAHFPTVEALAQAPLADVLKTWEGLGYYSRARNLHRTAQIIVEEHGGCLPEDAPSLLALPGIGRYTAGAIRSLAFNQPAPILDGNIRRVITRLDDIAESIDETVTEKRLWQRAEEMVHVQQPGMMNEALMELGALICLPKIPRCQQCPVRDFCLAHKNGTQFERPVRKPRRRLPHYDVVAGIVWNASQPDLFLIAQRPLDGMLGGMWEFPGGKLQPGETPQRALIRELEEELGIEVEVGKHVISLEHAYTHFRISLHAYHARLRRGEPQCRQVADWRWVRLPELDQFAFARTDQQIIGALARQSEANSSLAPP